MNELCAYRRVRVSPFPRIRVTRYTLFLTSFAHALPPHQAQPAWPVARPGLLFSPNWYERTETSNELWLLPAKTSLIFSFALVTNRYTSEKALAQYCRYITKENIRRYCHCNTEEKLLNINSSTFVQWTNKLENTVFLLLRRKSTIKGYWSLYYRRKTQKNLPLYYWNQSWAVRDTGHYTTEEKYRKACHCTTELDVYSFLFPREESCRNV